MDGLPISRSGDLDGPARAIRSTPAFGGVSARCNRSGVTRGAGLRVAEAASGNGGSTEWATSAAATGADGGSVTLCTMTISGIVTAASVPGPSSGGASTDTIGIATLWAASGGAATCRVMEPPNAGVVDVLGVLGAVGARLRNPRMLLLVMDCSFEITAGFPDVLPDFSSGLAPGGADIRSGTGSRTNNNANRG